MDKIELRNRFGNVMAGNLKGPVADNLAIALCMYFDNDPEKPCEAEDEQLGWTPWVIEQVNATLDALVEEAVNYFTPKEIYKESYEHPPVQPEGGAW